MASAHCIEIVTGPAARARRRRRSRARARPSERTGPLARRPSRASPPRGWPRSRRCVAPAASASATACWKDARAASMATVAATRMSAAVRSSITDAAYELPSTAIAVKKRFVVHGEPPQVLLVLVHWRRAHLTCRDAASASYFLDEIRPRRVDRVLHEPDLDGALDRLTTRRDTELAVDGHRFRLRRVAGDEEPVRDLREGEMGCEVRKQPQLQPSGSSPRHRPARSFAATRSRSSRASSTREPRSGGSLEHQLGLRENRPSGGRLGECEVGTGWLPDRLRRPSKASRGRAWAADGGRAPMPIAPPRGRPRGARPAQSPHARLRCSRSHLGPSRRWSPVPPAPVRRRLPRHFAWPHGARAVPEPPGRRRPGRPGPPPPRWIASGPPSHDRLRRAARGRRRAWERAGDPPTSRRELIERQIRVGKRTFDTVPHHVRAQCRDPGLDRGTAIRGRAGRLPICLRESAIAPRLRAFRSARGSTLRRRRVQDAAPGRPRRTVRTTPRPYASGRRSRAAGEGPRAGLRRRRSHPQPARRAPPAQSGHWRRTRPSPGG